MRSVKLRTAGIITLLALAGAAAAMAPVDIGTIAQAPANAAISTAMTAAPPATAGPTTALTCPGEVIWRPTPRPRTPRVNRTPPRPPPGPPPIPQGPIGRIEGRVTDAKTGQLLESALVTLDGAPSGWLTDLNGRYTVPYAAVGERTVNVRILGYAEQRRQVTVAEGQTTVADFVLEQSVLNLQELNLQELVVTGMARGVPRVKLPFTVSTNLRVPPPGISPGYDINTESYAPIGENRFRHVSESPLSTFAIDVDRASYANVRRFIQEGNRPPSNAVRIEEMINYFPYEWGDVPGDHPFAVTTEMSQAPWKREHHLVRIGLHAPSVDTRDLPPSNLVFLLDVSGSMDEPNKLPLLQSAFALLADRLRPRDRVTVLTYSTEVCLALRSTTGDRKDEILAMIERLQPGGGTAGGPALQLAYDIAREHHVDGGNNRIILATDGDFNIGPASDEAMVELVEKEREAGTQLTVLGFGTGNLKDSKMEQIADNGNGNFHYVDGLLEARKVLIEEMGGTLLTLAKDVKLQVEFNPARIAGYRLIGYENRLLADEDFNDDTKDAGELGAGHTVTALYEVVPVGTEVPRGVDALRYQPQPDDPPPSVFEGELMYVKVRYKDPDGTRSKLLQQAVAGRPRSPSTDFRFATAVAGFGMLLRDSPHTGTLTLDDVVSLAEGSRGGDPRGYRGEFIRLVEVARDIKLLDMEAVESWPGRWR